MRKHYILKKGLDNMSEKRETAKGIIKIVGGCCTSWYSGMLLTAICPPVGIAATVGQILLGSKLGDFGAEKAGDLFDCVCTLKDKLKDKS